MLGLCHQNQNAGRPTSNPQYTGQSSGFGVTQNPLSDEDMAVLKGKNPQFSGQTYGEASGGLVCLEGIISRSAILGRVC